MRMILNPLTANQRNALTRLRDEGAQLIHADAAGALKKFGYAVRTDQPGRRAYVHLVITERGRKRLDYPG